MQSRTIRDKNRERTRNFILVLLAVGMVVLFFNLDMAREGESLFSRTVEQKLSFTGDLERRAYTSKEVERLLAFVRRHDALLENVTIETSLQDRYRSVGPSTELLFEIRMVTTDGGTISAPTRRALRKNLVQAILAKLDKDIRAYKKVNEDNDKAKSLINTM